MLLHGDFCGDVVPPVERRLLNDLVVFVSLPGREEGAADEFIGVRLADGAAHPGVEVHVCLLLQDTPENVNDNGYEVKIVILQIGQDKNK